MYILHELLRRQAPGGNSGGPGGGGNDDDDNSNGPTSASSPTATPFPKAQPTSTSNDNNSTSGSKINIIIPVIVVFVVLLIVVFTIFACRSLRRKHQNPKYVPTKFLKKRWQGWEPGRSSTRLPQTTDHLERSRNAVPPPNFEAATAAATATAAAAGVDRHTSVRSVMTLPAYHMSARENEQVLGREGERAGIDTVVEFPEGADEEEARREQEMEALYQVRVARRRENEERDERRRLRREARERSDWVALRELQNRSASAASENAGRSVAELRAEHERLKAERLRTVSSVAYGDLGIARHDGTRLRANSEESERQGLLGDAASIAASSRYHRRDRSASSIISIDTMNSDLPSPGLTRSRANSRAESPLRRVSTSNSAGRAGSSPEIIDHETAGDDIPPNSPPGYENISLDSPQAEVSPQVTPQEPPPDYTSPVAARGEGPSIDPTASRRASQVEHLAAKETRPGHERRTSTGSLVPGSSRERRASASSAHSSRGVGGIPQLPSLRLGSLPSIVVDSGTPVVHRERQIDEEDSQ